MNTPEEQARRGWSVRQRLMLLVVGLMTLGLLTTGLLSFTLQYSSLTDRIDAELLQEVDELGRLAQAGPERSGEPYADADELFRDFLATSVAGEDEAMIAFVDGEPSVASGGQRPFDIDHPDVLSTMEQLGLPEGRALTTSLSTQGTVLRIVAADVQLPQETRTATFVVANDLGRQRAEIVRRIVGYVGASFLVLLVTGTAAHIVLGRVLRPLRTLQETTAAIGGHDLSRRVTLGPRADTDVSELAVRFNGMLDRIEDGVRDQRQFLDDAAHELRTPLTILRGNAELLRPADPEDVAATRQLLLDEVDRMQRLVDDLLVLAKTQRHDFLRPAPTDLAELAVECMERISALGDRSWRLNADAEGTAVVDRQRIIQALVQLSANAVKFSEGGTSVELTTRWVPGYDGEADRARRAGARPAVRYLALSVSDHGSGIPQGQVVRVFDRFGRADNAAQTEGSGLGLAIVSAIAHGHSGGVGVESVEGVGSRFTIWIPDDGEQDDSELSQDGSRRSAGVRSPTGRTTRDAKVS